MTGSALAARVPALALALALIALVLCTLGLSPHVTPGGSATIGSAMIESATSESAVPGSGRSISLSPVESSDPCDPGEHAACDPIGHTMSISTTSSTPRADLALVHGVAGVAATARAPLQVAPAPPSLIRLSVLRL